MVRYCYVYTLYTRDWRSDYDSVTREPTPSKNLLSLGVTWSFDVSVHYTWYTILTILFDTLWSYTLKISNIPEKTEFLLSGQTRTLWCLLAIQRLSSSGSVLFYYNCNTCDNFFHVKTSLARLLSGKCPQKALRSVIGTRSIGRNGQRLIVLFKDEFDLQLDMNSDPCISTNQHRTTIDVVFMRGIEHSKSQVWVSYFSHQKPIETCLSFYRNAPIFLAWTLI